jgi:hypothetical protein
MIYNLACVRLAQGKIDEAIVLLEKAKGTFSISLFL